MKDRGAQIQQAYYARTADTYDAVHLSGQEGAEAAMRALVEAVAAYEIRSVLDVGSGTGRVLRHLEAVDPDLRLVGIEPSSALRQAGEPHLKRARLIDGDAQKLSFADGEFDLVCEFAALHHMPNPRAAVKEMIRVARKAVFICDSNNFGGPGPFFALKRAINAVGLWPAFDWLKTGGKGYSISEGDGLFYSYSVFTDLPLIRASCSAVQLIDTERCGSDLYRRSPNLTVLALKDSGSAGVDRSRR